MDYSSRFSVNDIQLAVCPSPFAVRGLQVRAHIRRFAAIRRSLDGHKQVARCYGLRSVIRQPSGGHPAASRRSPGWQPVATSHPMATDHGLQLIIHGSWLVALSLQLAVLAKYCTTWRWVPQHHAPQVIPQVTLRRARGPPTRSPDSPPPLSWP